MDFTYPAEAEAFRAEFRAWLDVHLTDDIRALGGARGSLDPEWLERMRAWTRTLAEARYAAIAWPEEYGGRGAGVLEQVVWTEEMHRAGAPPTLNPIGLSNIAPAIMHWGTDEQRRTLLPRMLRGDDIWCQGFSEPNAGSDLASLSTSAVDDGDAFVVNGQKTWNTWGQFANWCELLVRTDPAVPKHQGISCLLVDMTMPGVEVRPIKTIASEGEFNELFFTDVRVPKAALLGPVNEGWRVAMTTLAYERGGVAALHLGLRARIARLLELARETVGDDGRPVADDPVARQALMRLYLEGELLKLLSDRAISGVLHGRQLGPEGSLAKLVWSEAEQRAAELVGLVLGPDAHTGTWGRDLAAARSYTIAGGTTQVNKNIIAQRVLGLPRGT